MMWTSGQCGHKMAFMMVLFHLYCFMNINHKNLLTMAEIKGILGGFSGKVGTTIDINGWEKTLLRLQNRKATN